MNEPLRVGWYNGQVLARDDFEAAEAYHGERLRRHLGAAHIWGIVRGLDLMVDEDGGLAVAPGMAIDGYGRELLLAAALPITKTPFVDRDTDALDVWLIWREFAQPDDSAARRFLERPGLDFTLPVPDPTPRTPKVVAAGDVALGPFVDAAPPEKLWPVYLGRVTCDQSKDPAEFTIDPRGRPYAGLVAESIEAPSGTARLLLGMNDKGEGQLAVSLRKSAAGNFPDEPQFRISADGTANIANSLDVAGDVLINDGALFLRKPTAEAQADTAAPDGTIQAQFEMLESVGASARATFRLQIPDEGLFEVGSWSAKQKKFVPILTVDPSGEGSVTVKGLVEGGNVETVGGLSEAAQAMVTGAFFSGLSAVASASASSLPHSVGSGFFAASVPTGDLAKILGQALGDDADLRASVVNGLFTNTELGELAGAIVTAFVNNIALRQRVTKWIKESYPDVAEDMRDELAPDDDG